MPTRTPLIAGNWKMNGLRDDGVALTRAVIAGSGDLGSCDLWIAPPATLVRELAAAAGSATVSIGGQDCHPDVSGAHTGDISAAMLKDAGCSFVIVGHSERRQDHGEDDVLVKAKASAALAEGLIAIVCVGESEADRDAGRAVEVTVGQIEKSLPDEAAPARVVVAYEPVWAIGTGRTPTTDEIADMHASIRQAIDRKWRHGEDFRLLYGGSVKPANAAEILGLDDVDGALVGGASLKAEDFLAIARASA